jgi:uncharacterized protein YndB with AHSA1/START domain
MTTTTHETTIEASQDVPTITITREFDAPRELVWRAHTDPDLYVRWIGPRSVGTTMLTWDVRRGGSWAFANTRDDEEIARFFGSFHDVRPQERIVWTFTYEGAPDGVALETLTFEELPDGRTRLRIISVVESFELRDSVIASGMETGVVEGYEKLDDLLTTL